MRIECGFILLSEVKNKWGRGDSNSGHKTPSLAGWSRLPYGPILSTTQKGAMGLKGYECLFLQSNLDIIPYLSDTLCQSCVGLGRLGLNHRPRDPTKSHNSTTDFYINP